jgi:hypothetical protein
MRSSLCDAAAFFVIVNGDSDSVDATFRPRFRSGTFTSDDTVGFVNQSYESQRRMMRIAIPQQKANAPVIAGAFRFDRSRGITTPW